jgi:hypothetical protein
MPACESFPSPAANAPSVPCTGVWLSDPTTTMPGPMKPARTTALWMFPLPQSSTVIPCRRAQARFASRMRASLSVGGENRWSKTITTRSG